MKKILLPVSALMISMGLSAQTYFSEDFSTGLGGWTLTDSDADGNDWAVFTSQAPNDAFGDCMTSASWNTNPLTPDNWVVSSAISIPGGAPNAFLKWKVYAQDQAWTAENYTVYVATASDIATLGASTTTFTEVLTTSAGFMDRSLDLSAFIGQTIYVAFRHHNVTDQFRMNIDEVYVKSLLPNNAKVNSLSLMRYSAVSTNNQLGIEVINEGSTAITSLDIDWNDGAAHSQTITVSIAPGATVMVNHPDMVTYATAVEKNINVTITQVNGGADSDPSNNTASALHNTVSQLATKKVVIEEGTGTWCGWCPRGAVAMDHMSTTYPDQFIGVAVHNGDPMTVAEYDAGAAFSGFPGANVDREILGGTVGVSNFEGYYNDRKDMIVPAAIAVASSGTGANVVLDVTATFYTPFAAANYRLGVIIVENGVTGTASGYNQTNYYAGGGNGAMGGFESLADPVPAADMVYNHVGRAVLGGYGGQAGSVPAVITDGQAVVQQFTYTVPATSERWRMHAVAVLIDQTNGQIVTAEEVAIGEVGINELNVENVVVFPNPATNVLNVSFDANSSEYSIAVIDLQGRTVASANVNNVSGQQTVSIPVANLAKGSYLVRVSSNGASTVQNVVIK